MRTKTNVNTHAMAGGGFTLIELVIVIAIFSLLAALALAMSMDTLKGFFFRSERETIVALLEKARSRAMANWQQSPHGLCFDPSGPAYVLFRGAAYDASDPANEHLPGNPAVAIASSPALFFCGAGGIAFAQISGAALQSADISITQGGRASDVSITSQGAIDWR